MVGVPPPPGIGSLKSAPVVYRDAVWWANMGKQASFGLQVLLLGDAICTGPGRISSHCDVICTGASPGRIGSSSHCVIICTGPSPGRISSHCDVICTGPEPGGITGANKFTLWRYRHGGITRANKFLIHKFYIIANYLDCFMVPNDLRSPSSAHTYILRPLHGPNCFSLNLLHVYWSR